MKILVIEDDRKVAGFIEQGLREEGYAVDVAQDGDEGTMLAHVYDYDVILLDVMMPKKSGFLVLEKLKSRPDGGPKIIMITANEGSRHRAYAEALGVDDYIRKPFDMNRLLDAVGRLCPLSGEPVREEVKKEEP